MEEQNEHYRKIIVEMRYVCGAQNLFLSGNNISNLLFVDAYFKQLGWFSQRYKCMVVTIDFYRFAWARDRKP